MTDGTVQALRHTVRDDLETAPGTARQIVQRVLSGAPGLTFDAQLTNLRIARAIAVEWDGQEALDALNTAIAKVEERKAAAPPQRETVSEDEDDEDEDEDLIDL